MKQVRGIHGQYSREGGEERGRKRGRGRKGRENNLRRVSIEIERRGRDRQKDGKQEK